MSKKKEKNRRRGRRRSDTDRSTRHSALNMAAIVDRSAVIGRGDSSNYRLCTISWWEGATGHCHLNRSLRRRFLSLAYIICITMHFAASMNCSN